MPTNQIEKQPAETFIVGVDFSSRLSAGESVVLAGSSCAEEDTIEPGSEVTIIESGTLDISGSSSLVVRISGGVNTHRYKLSFRAATNLGNLYEHDIIVRMVD